MKHPTAPYARVPLLTAAALALLLGACTTRTVRAPGAGVAAQLSVETFLQAANQRDLETMGRVFGTAEGPILDTGSTLGCMFRKMGSWFGGEACVKREEVEIRLDAIANVLRHDDYRVVREEAVAGRMTVATRVWVDLTVRGQRVSEVPFVVVRSGSAWLVEQVDLQRVMAGARD